MTVELEVGRHRRVDQQLVVHLVFGDLSEATLGPNDVLGRSIGQLAAWLAARCPQLVGRGLQDGGQAPDKA
jgi:hypothetical protein